MRNLLIALGAIVVLVAAAVLLLSSGPAPAPAGPGTGTAAPEGPGPDPSTGGVAPAAGSPGGAPAASPGSPGAGQVRGPGGHRPSGAEPRAPKIPPGGATPGEIRKDDLPEDQAAKVEETRRTLFETNLGRVEWRGTTLKAAAEEIAEKSGVAVTLEGDDLADEPVQMGGDAVTARLALDHIAASRVLRFEITPGKVVIKR